MILDSAAGDGVLPGAFLELSLDAAALLVFFRRWDSGMSSLCSELASEDPDFLRLEVEFFRNRVVDLTPSFSASRLRTQ